MKNHVKIYLDHAHLSEGDFIPCEICYAMAVDIHHIQRRGIGGSKDKDTADNLMALCRKCHIDYGDLKQFKDLLQKKHNEYLKSITN